MILRARRARDTKETENTEDIEDIEDIEDTEDTADTENATNLWAPAIQDCATNPRACYRAIDLLQRLLQKPHKAQPW